MPRRERNVVFPTLLLVLGPVLVSCMSDAAIAQCALQTLSDSAGLTGDNYGSTIAFDGAHAVVGVPQAEKALVYRFDGSGWTEVATLTSASTTPLAFFGGAVDIDGTVIAVSASADNEAAPNAGAVIVFRYDGTGWVEEAKLTANDAEVNDLLGTGLAVHGDTVIAGALSATDPSVYAFRREAGVWNEVQRIVPVPFVDSFGSGVDFDGRRLVVTSVGPTPRVDFFRWELGEWSLLDTVTGTPGEVYKAMAASGHRVAIGALGLGGGSGGVIVYRFDGASWMVDETITQPGSDSFGSAVALEGDTLVVGASATLDPSLPTGVAYVYRRESSGWELIDTLNAGSADDGAQHGAAVALCGEIALVGAPLGDSASPDSGIVSSYAIPVASSERLTASNPGDSMWFGWSVATWGSRVLAGSPNASGPVLSTPGAAYVLRDEGGAWVESAILNASDGVNGDNFGIALDIHGDLAMVGAPQRNDGEGAAYIFRFDGTDWVEEQMLVGSDAVGQEHEYGVTVVIRGEVALVGSIFDDTLGPPTGAIYVYEYDGIAGLWSEVQKLVPSQPDAFAAFGQSVVIDGNTILAGASGTTLPVGLAAAGAVYVFEYDGTTWNESQVLTPSDPDTSNRFGNHVAGWGGWTAVGTRFGDEGGVNSGSVTLFRFDGDSWVEHEILVPSLIDPNDQLGSRVALSSGFLAVSSPQDDLVEIDAGAVYTYRWGEGAWEEGPRFISAEQDELEGFGNGIAVGPGRLVAGAPFTDGAFVNTGTTTIFSLQATICDEQFVRGDANQDGVVNIADVVTLLDYLFSGTSTTCVDLFDVNANASLSITDAFQLLCSIFCEGDAAILPPFPDCGTNLYGPGLGCDAYGGCP